MDHHIRIPQKVSGRLVSKRPISLSRAAKLISRFAAVENGSSPAVSLYLQRTADAFNRLVQSRDKRSKAKNPDAPGSQRTQTEEDSEKVAREREEIVDGGDAAEAPGKRKNKKKKRGSGEDNVDSKSTPTEKDSEKLVRERETDVVNEADAAGTPKKKKTKKSDEASSDSKNIQTEIKTEIINAAAEAEAPAKKKKKKKKNGESGSKK